MLHLSSDGHGGFFLFDNPIDDLLGNLGVNAFFLGMIIMLIMPISINPTEFAAPLLCILLGFFLILVFAGMGFFKFMSAFSLPFLVCGTAAYSAAVFHNAPASPVSLLLMIFIPFAVWLVQIAVMVYFFGGSIGLGMMASIVSALVITFCTIGFSPTKHYVPPAALYYMIRITWVAAFIKASAGLIYELIQSLKKKYRLDFVSPAVHLPLILAGFLPLLVMKLLPGLVGFLAGTAAYVAIATFYCHIQNAAKADRFFEPGLLMIPLLWVFMAYLSTMSHLLFRPEGITQILNWIQFHGSAFFYDLYFQVTEAAGAAFGMILRLLINLILMIFDTSVPYFHMPNMLSFVIILAMEWLLVTVLPKKILKVKT